MYTKISNSAADNKTLAGNIKRALERANITIPEPKPTKFFTAENRPNLHELVTEEISNNRDPLDNENIRTELMRKLLDNTVNSYTTIELQESKNALQHYLNHADTILDQLGETFDQAMNVLTEKHKQIGGGNLENMGADRHHVARAEATVALNTTQAILDAWPMLVPFLTGKDTGSNQPHLKFMKPTLEQTRTYMLRDGRHQTGRNLNPWDALEYGVEVDLALDPTQVRERHEALDAEAKRERANALNEMRL